MTPAEVRAFHAAPEEQKVLRFPAPVTKAAGGVADLRRSVAKWLPFALRHPHASDWVVRELLNKLRAVIELTNADPMAAVEALEDAAPTLVVDAYAQANGLA